MGGKREEYLQCNKCGHIAKSEIRCRDDDLYIRNYCPQCEEATTHLRCGEQPEEIYRFYDVVNDPRYY